MKTTPKYLLIANQLRQRILDGDLAVGTQLPQEKRLIKAYNVSRITVRKALDILEQEGLIYRIQGAGTFVQQSQHQGHTVNQNQAELFDLTDLNVEVSQFTVLKPAQQIAQILRLNQYDLTYVVERILSYQNTPVILQNLYFPTKYIQGMRLDALKLSIPHFLTNELGVDLASISRDFDLAKLSTTPAAQLQVSPQQILLLITEKFFLKNGAIGGFSRNWINTDKYHYQTRMQLT